MSKTDQERGLYSKYMVVRNNDPESNHVDCDYFVLDLTYDRFAKAALKAYAEACAAEYPFLAADLRAKL